VVEYHKTISSEYIVYSREKVKRKWGFQYGISLGINYSELKFSRSAQGNSVIIGGITFDPHLLSSTIVQNFVSEFVSRSRCVYLLPGIALSMSPDEKNFLLIEALFGTSKYDFGQFSIKNQQLYMPILFERQFRYKKQTRPCINAGVAVFSDLTSQINNAYISYLMPQYNVFTNVLMFEPFEANLTSENTIRKTLGAQFMVGLGIRRDLTNKLCFKLEARTYPSTTPHLV
jgi:hypothetical protein